MKQIEKKRHKSWKTLNKTEQNWKKQKYKMKINELKYIQSLRLRGIKFLSHWKSIEMNSNSTKFI